MEEKTNYLKYLGKLVHIKTKKEEYHYNGEVSSVSGEEKLLCVLDVMGLSKDVSFDNISICEEISIEQFEVIKKRLGK